MIKHILKPNLPEHNVAEIICGTDDNSILDFFSRKDITVYKNNVNTSVDMSVSTHADMSALHIGGSRLILDKTQTKLSRELSEKGFDVLFTERNIEGLYPEDVKLNFTVIGDKIIGKICNADKNILDFFQAENRINVKQGYCKCSTLVVNENAVITDDVSIHREMLKNQIDSLLVSKGDVLLEGHEYGFIGGASGKISKDTIIFFGDIKKHSDFSSIEEFLLKHGCKYICTDNNQLRDIGGFLPISENI